MPIFVAIFMVPFIACILGSYVLWGMWIAPFVKDHGGRTALFSSWAPMQDYRTAVKLSKKTGDKPWFLKAFEIAFAVEIVLLLVWIPLCHVID